MSNAEFLRLIGIPDGSGLGVGYSDKYDGLSGFGCGFLNSKNNGHGIGLIQGFGMGNGFGDGELYVGGYHDTVDSTLKMINKKDRKDGLV